MDIIFFHDVQYSYLVYNMRVKKTRRLYPCIINIHISTVNKGRYTTMLATL